MVMVCVVCGWWMEWKYRIICGTCTGRLRRGGEVRLDSGLLVRSLFIHKDPIRSAVHAFKYHGIDRIARVLAPWLADMLPDDASALVPIPRSLARRMRFGVDPGRVLAFYVAGCAGLPVADILRAPPYRRSQLRERRSEGIRFRLVGSPPHRSVLLDDVLTTGATLSAASVACQGRISRAVTLTRSPVTVSA